MSHKDVGIGRRKWGAHSGTSDLLVKVVAKPKTVVRKDKLYELCNEFDLG